MGIPSDPLPALLAQVATGSQEAQQALSDTLYGQLRSIARKHLVSERVGHTLSATALVHEAYMKVADQRTPTERAHFLAVASVAMRRVLVSHARGRLAEKRGAGERPVTLDEALLGGSTNLDTLLTLDEILGRLEALSERQAQALVYKGFGALTDAEIARVQGISIPTVRRDLRLASAFVKRELAQQ